MRPLRSCVWYGSGYVAVQIHYMIIHRNCYGTILLVWFICAPVAYLALRFIPWIWLSYPIAAVAMFLMGFVAFFFRVPQRCSAGAANSVTSVADGKVVVVERAYESEYIKGECLQISVYMDFYNVHVNFWPIDGVVSYYRYHPGKYMFAYLPKASELNEHTSVGMETSYGKVFFKQIAGTFARRIVSHAEVGKEVIKATECGIIKFGSRLDMFLPVDADVKVCVGEHVKACDTVLAELKK